MPHSPKWMTKAAVSGIGFAFKQIFNCIGAMRAATHLGYTMFDIILPENWRTGPAPGHIFWPNI